MGALWTFSRELERTLGGPDAVVAAYRAWQAAEDTAEAEMAPDLALAKRWMAAAARARNDGPREVGETEAWFGIKLVRLAADVQHCDLALKQDPSRHDEAL